MMTKRHGNMYDIEGGFEKQVISQGKFIYRKKHIFILISICCLLVWSLHPSASSKYQGELYEQSRKSETVRSYSNFCERKDYSCHIYEALKKQGTLLQRQSTTVEGAVKEYVRRYQRQPPKGFEGWVTYALENDALLIDEYDQIEESLRAFRDISPSVLQSRMDAALVANAEVVEARRLGELIVKDGKVTVSGYSYALMTNSTVVEILENIQDRLPDLRVLYNWISQPRVLGVQGGNEVNEDKESTDVVFQDRAEKDNWDLLRNSCPGKYISSPPISSDRQSLDICALQDSNRDEHGIFVAPRTFVVTDTLVPILSRGKLSTNRDILIPNTCYWNNDYRGWNRIDEIPFEEKQPSLYWRGMSTGEVVTKDNFYKSHRLRFINLMQWLRGASELFHQFKEEAEIDPEDLTEWQQLEQTRRAANLTVEPHIMEQLQTFHPGMYDAAFSRVYFADNEETENRMYNEYRFTHHEKANSMFSHQYLPDIDGESMSCRFYSQLGSNGVPLKQTLFAEWHDDRIIPWAHFIPISTGYSEVPELLVWLRSAEGQKLSAIIAREGAFWEKHLFRKVDITLYYYRLLLEYAALFNSDG